MVTFRREIRLWRETGVTQRALMIRDDADTYWLASPSLLPEWPIRGTSFPERSSGSVV